MTIKKRTDQPKKERKKERKKENLNRQRYTCKKNNKFHFSKKKQQNEPKKNPKNLSLKS